MRSRRPSGVTLLELLVVAALTGFMAVAVFSNFSAGVRLWAAMQGRSPIEDFNIFHLRTSHDFAGAFQYSPIVFTGTPERVSFAGAVDAVPALGGDRAIGQIGYTYDPAHRVLMRQQRDISQLFTDKDGENRAVLQNVTAFKISYLGFDKLENLFIWQESWEDKKGELPKAVRMELTRAGDGGLEPMTLVFQVPAGAGS